MGIGNNSTTREIDDRKKKSLIIVNQYCISRCFRNLEMN